MDIFLLLIEEAYTTHQIWTKCWLFTYKVPTYRTFNRQVFVAGGVPTDTTARSNPPGDARTPNITCIGGFGLPPDMERMLSGAQDPSQMNQLLQNPAVGQIMQSILPNHQYMNQVLGLDPQLRGLLESSPQLREMM